MNEYAIETVGLTKKYRGFTLDGLTLSLPRGAVMGLIGENGAGKTTAIKALLDIVKRDSGSVTLLGRDACDDLKLTKEEIGVVFDNVGLPATLTAKRVGKIMASAYKNWDGDVYKEYLDRFGLNPNKYFSDYSLGMRKKLGIAVALSHGAKLLILDEATSGLDPVVRDEVVGIFSDFTRDEDKSVLISSHIVSDLEKICDYIAFLHERRLILCEEKDRLLERFAILHCDEKLLSSLPADAVTGTKLGHYGAEALVDREKLRTIPIGAEISPAGIEDIFIFTVKGGKA